jgi:hypothetical protein
MTSLPPTMAMETAVTRQNVAMSVIKAAHDQEQRIIRILDEAVRSAPVSASRGTNVNFSV